MFLAGNESALAGQSEKLSDFIRRMVALGEELLPKIEDVKAEKMGDMIDEEMEETQKSIEAAAKRIAVSFLTHNVQIIWQNVDLICTEQFSSDVNMFS